LAPTDTAFEQAARDLGFNTTQLLNSTALLSALLRHHTIPGGAFTSANLTNGLNLTTGLASEDNLTVVMLPGGNITFVSTPKLIGDSPWPVALSSTTNSNGTNTIVIVSDIRWQATGAAVIHVVDTVLIPPTMKQIWDELGAACIGRKAGKIPGAEVLGALPGGVSRFRPGVGAPAGEYSFIHSCYTCGRSSYKQRLPIPDAANSPN
jgi:hypothetical protein